MTDTQLYFAIGIPVLEERVVRAEGVLGAKIDGLGVRVKSLEDKIGASPLVKQ